MKVLIYAPLAVLGHHFETDLELIQTHLAAGDDVVFLGCNGSLKNLRFMSCLGIGRCNLCISRRENGFELLQPNAEKLNSIYLKPLQEKSFPITEDLKSAESVKKVKFKDMDLGSALMSSLISELRDPTPNMKDRVSTTQKELYQMANLAEQFEAALDQVTPDLVYFFNGRFSIYRPLLRVCQQRGVEFYVHERGSNNKSYSLTHNNIPHHILTIQNEILAAWRDENISMHEKIKKSEEWFENRSKGVLPAWRSFVDQQKKDLLPEGWDAKLKNISIFISSEDEFSSVPGFELELFRSQSDAIDFICKSFSEDKTFKFYVRLHPNLRGLKNKSISEMLALGEKWENCHIIPADSDVSSYALIHQSQKIISFGSTVGIEATFWKKPSILIGKSFYMNLECCYVPRSQSEVLNLISDADLKPTAYENVLKFGYWSSTVGTPFKYYKAVNLTTGYFNNQILTGNKLAMWINYFFVLVRDVIKIMKGEYGFWHLLGKIKNKTKLLCSRS